jgi:formate dehydrogenase maturation protein FdhE
MDSSIYWPHILQVLVPTFSAFSVAQGYVDSDPLNTKHDDDLARSLEDEELEGMGEEAAERRRRVEEERRGRMCPICLGKPVAGRMTKCGHVSSGWCLAYG